MTTPWEERKGEKGDMFDLKLALWRSFEGHEKNGLFSSTFFFRHMQRTYIVFCLNTT